MRISENVRSTHDADGGIVLDVRHGRMYALNFVGSRIVELLKQDWPTDQIANEISQQFGIAPDVARADVREFLASLEKQELIARRDTAVRL
jgi:hypothetical protein